MKNCRVPTDTSSKQYQPVAHAVLGEVPIVLAVACVVAVGLHGWPMEGRPLLRFFWPANIVTLVWVGWVLAKAPRLDFRQELRGCLPGNSVWMYLSIAMLSVAAAENLLRVSIAAAKLTLGVVGTYTLVAAACRSRHAAKCLPWAMVVTVCAVLIHAVVQAVNGYSPIALFESPLKLGSYLAMAIPFAASWLASRRQVWMKAWATLIVVAGFIACTSIWAWLGMLVALTTVGVVARSLRGWLLLTLFGTSLVINIPLISSSKTALVHDAQWREVTGHDVRQRYIEWQAMINMLKERSAAGTGIGCLNDHRSEYYWRLPKNNTIAAFDQNGYLAAAAEMGLPGLIALCGLLGAYLKRGWCQRNDPCVRAAWAGLAGAVVAQVASSVAYNGILVLFVLILAVIDHGRAVDEHTDRP